MNESERSGQSSGMSVPEVLRILFRHKWKIILFSSGGVVAAVLLYFLKPATYYSEAKLFIRYVVDAKVPTVTGEDPNVRIPDAAGGNIINSEVEILRSLDLAREVVDLVGVQKFVPGAAGEEARYQAVEMFAKGLGVEVPPRSSIVRVVFHTSNRTLAQPVLEQLIDSYLKKHDDIHRPVGAYDELLTQQRDNVRSQLNETERELRDTKAKLGVISLEETKRAYTEEISRVRQEVFDTEAQLAECRAALKQMGVTEPQATAATNSAISAVPPDVATEHSNLRLRIDALRRRELELSTQFTGENVLLTGVRQQIATDEALRRTLEEKHPGLTNIAAVAAGPAPATRDHQPTAASETARVVALDAKLQILRQQMETLTKLVAQVNESEATITQLERQKGLQEGQYKYFSSSLEQARFDQALGAGKTSNIGVAQHPSPAFRESRQLIKLVAMVVIGGLVAGLGLAFALELYLDPSVKSVGELERRFRLPTFLSIPATGRNGRIRRKDILSGAEAQLSHGGSEATQNGQTQIVPWEPGKHLRPYYEGLRDRLITWFEVQNLTRKPKLVAVTGCDQGAGVSSIAAGLAATLSETGDGNVLLVDMNVGHGAAHSFYKGQPGCGLEEALEDEKREEAQVQENLFAVAEGNPQSDKLRSLLPRKFSNLVPKLKASDYDYIIFDMPPVSPITPTPRLCSYMDMVLLVVQAEKTSRESVKAAANLLSQSKATVATVFNKTRSHSPKWLARFSASS